MLYINIHGGWAIFQLSSAFLGILIFKCVFDRKLNPPHSSPDPFSLGDASTQREYLCLICCCKLYACTAVSNSVDIQVPLSVAFCRSEYWSVLPFPTSGDLPNPWIKPASPALKVVS